MLKGGTLLPIEGVHSKEDLFSQREQFGTRNGKGILVVHYVVLKGTRCTSEEQKVPSRGLRVNSCALSCDRFTLQPNFV